MGALAFAQQEAAEAFARERVAEGARLVDWRVTQELRPFDQREDDGLLEPDQDMAPFAI